LEEDALVNIMKDEGRKAFAVRIYSKLKASNPKKIDICRTPVNTKTNISSGR
jgi:hypothetical protein